MKKILEYALETTGYVEVDMPLGAETLQVGSVTVYVVVWVLVIPGERTVTRKFYVCPSDYIIPNDVLNDGTYLGTATTERGHIWHIYDLGDKQGDDQ